MTPDEYRDALGKLDDPQFYKFWKRFGGTTDTREVRVREYIDKPEHERKICYVLNTMYNLGLKTEDEKIVEATTKSAEAAIRSAKASEKSAETAEELTHLAAASAKAATESRRIAFGALIATIVIAVVSLVTLFWKLTP